ncbi:ABC transporter substrate-binding protein [Spirochaeta lutea]|uniref:Probable sugar-binding periplasmic protein n=1 Tax=Spirochaeta lutea TaxID=1480694 RepID=A0A098QUE6_9SPIO|nr:extracellular solute-binding protein [Spirochaeta lutea]KGE71028.1 sugar-binding protein [Spirochaeta lutea]
MKTGFRKFGQVLILLLCSAGLFAGGGGESQEGQAGGVTQLTLGSWRTDDVAQIEALLAEFHASHPEIRIKFDPVNPPDYNATLRLQLESGIAPDIFYARSYATGEELFQDGYMVDLSGEDFVQQNYDEGARSPWTAGDGGVFAMPFLAVSHGIYYNKDLFAELGIQVPKTWEELMRAARTIQDAGYIPFANGIADEWDIAEVVFMSLAPNFIGGREGRLAYDSGARKFNDSHVRAAFEAIEDLKPYLPEGFMAIGYNDSKALFQLGQAAMFFDGSWTISEFVAADPGFEWSVFPVPPPAGSPGYVTFHPDNGLAINPASDHTAEAKVFLEWLTTPQAAKVVGDQLPGFFPMISNAPQLDNPYANAFLSMNTGRGLDVRWPWPKMMSGNPSGYNLMMSGSIGVLTGELTPQQAADALQSGLAQWYPPAQ